MASNTSETPVILEAVDMAFTYCRDCGFEEPEIIGDHLGMALLVEHCLIEAGKRRDWMAIDVEAVSRGLPESPREREGLVVCWMRMLTWLAMPGPLPPQRVLEYLDEIESLVGGSRLVATHAGYCRSTLREVIDDPERVEAID